MINFFDDLHEYMGPRTVQQDKGTFIKIDFCCECYRCNLDDIENGAINLNDFMNCKYCDISQCFHVYKICTKCKVIICLKCIGTHAIGCNGKLIH